MTFIRSGASRTVILQIGTTLSVAAGPGTGAITRLANPQGGEPYSPVVYDGTAIAVGPFDDVAVFRMSCSTHYMDYTQSQIVGVPSSPRYTKSLAASQQTTVFIPAGSYLTVGATTGVGSFVPVTSGEPGTPLLFNGSAITVGPFDTLRVYRVFCSVGIIQFSTAYYAGAAPTPSPVLLAMDDRMAWDGDSITAGAYGPQPIDSAIVAMGGRLAYQGGQNIYNTAISGAKVADLSATSHLALTMASNPKCVFLLGGTNDLADNTDSAATIYGYLKIMWKYYIDNGAKAVVACCILPRGKGSALSTAREAVRVQLNNLIRAHASDPTLVAYAAKIVLVDLEATWNIATDTVTDGLHPNWVGARKLGTAMGLAAASILPTATLDGLHLLPGNLNVNKTFAGSGGQGQGQTGVTGTVPTNHFVELGTDLLVTLSATTDAAGFPALRMVVSGTIPADRSVIIGPHNIPMGEVIGDKFELIMRVKLVAGAQNLKTIYTEGISRPLQSPNAGETSLLSAGIDGFMRSQVTPVVGNTRGNEFCGVKLAFAAGTVSADLIISQETLRKAA